MSMLDGIPTTNVIDSDYQTAKWGQKYHKCFVDRFVEKYNIHHSHLIQLPTPMFVY